MSFFNVLSKMDILHEVAVTVDLDSGRILNSGMNGNYKKNNKVFKEE